MQAELMEQTQQIIINLGDTIAERMASITRIKEAMADAILLNVEMGVHTLNQENLEAYSSLYREANSIQHYLKLL